MKCYTVAVEGVSQPPSIPDILSKCLIEDQPLRNSITLHIEVIRLDVNEHPSGGNVRFVAAGHHVRRVPSLFPWRVISVLSRSSF